MHSIVGVGMRRSFALGLCATCYTLKQQDEEYFGGLREAIYNVMAIVAAYAEPRDAASGRLSSIIVYRVCRSCT